MADSDSKGNRDRDLSVLSDPTGSRAAARDYYRRRSQEESDAESDGSTTTYTAEAQEAVAPDVAPGTRPPHIAEIEGGRLRIYTDDEGRPAVVVRDDIIVTDGATAVIPREHATGERIKEWLEKYAPPDPNPPADTTEPDETPATETTTPPSRTTWERIRDWIENDEPLTRPPTADVSGGARPGMQDMMDALHEEDELFGSDKFTPVEVDDAFGRAQLNTIGQESAGQPPTPSPGDHTPGATATPADPMDPNPTNQVRQTSTRDMFDLIGGGTTTGTGTGGGGTGSGTGGSAGGSGGGTTPGGYDGGATDYVPRPGPVGTAGTSSGGGSGDNGGGDEGGSDEGDDDSGTNAAGGAAGNAGGGESSEGGSTGEAGSSAGGSTGTAPSGTVTIDYDGVVIEDEEETEVDTGATDSGADSGEEEEETGVSTSVDPMGGNYQPDEEDLERVAAWRNWQRGNVTPIDPDDNPTRETFQSDGELPVTPGVGQPGPDGPMTNYGDVDEDAIPRGGDQGDVTNPGPEGAALNPAGGPESDPVSDAFGPPPVNSPLPGGGGEDETESTPLQVAGVAQVNIVEAEAPPPEPGTMSAIYDPNSAQAQYNEWQQQQEQQAQGEDTTITNRYEFADREDSVVAFPAGGDTNRASSDGDDDDGSLFD